MSVLHKRAALCAVATILAALPASANAAVSATADGQGNLSVTGDGAADTVTITAANGAFVVNGTPTTITTGPARSISVDAGAGADTVDLSALTAEDYRQSIIRGGDDADTLSGGGGHDRVIGDKGNDTMSGNAGNDTLVWNNGDNTDVHSGGDGADEVEVNGSTTAGDVFTLKPGASAGRVQFDRVNLVPFAIDVSAERLTVNGLGGDDVISGSDDLAARTLLTLTGSTGTDAITGGDGADLISGGDDADTLDGAGGGDRVIGDRGSDTMRGGAADDVLVWNNGDGSDTHDGGDGNDRVEVNGAGTGDAFTVKPAPRPDGVVAARTEFKRTNLVPFTLDVDAEQLEVNGLGGDDALVAEVGVALAIHADGGAGNDALTSAGAASDVLDGQSGDDTIVSRGGGRDVVRGGVGSDKAQVDGADFVDAVESVDAAVADGKALQPRIGSVRIGTAGGRLIYAMRLTCPAAEAGGCAVRATLTTAKRALGSNSLTLEAGQTGTLKVRLAKGVARLAKNGRLAIRGSLVSTDAAGNTVRFTRSNSLGVPRR